MTLPLLIAMPGNEALAAELAKGLGYERGCLDTRQFPDGETYLRLASDPKERSVAFVCTLAHPNEKFLPLLFAAMTARELGACQVGLICPYLAYMRQDRRFTPGEAVTSRQVARLLSETFDWLVTVDPHLHRYGTLQELYSIPARAIHAAPLLSQWIGTHVAKPLLIGPDSESRQWVAAIADPLGAPYRVLEKVRHGDRDVEITLHDLDLPKGHTPVLIDDIISSGRTMIEAVRLLVSRGWPPPLCLAVHGLFADNAETLLASAGARIVTTNSVPHRTSAINVGPLLMTVIKELISTRSGARETI